MLFAFIWISGKLEEKFYAPTNKVLKAAAGMKQQLKKGAFSFNDELPFSSL